MRPEALCELWAAGALMTSIKIELVSRKQTAQILNDRPLILGLGKSCAFKGDFVEVDLIRGLFDKLLAKPRGIEIPRPELRTVGI